MDVTLVDATLQGGQILGCDGRASSQISQGLIFEPLVFSQILHDVYSSVGVRLIEGGEYRPAGASIAG